MTTTTPEALTEQARKAREQADRLAQQAREAEDARDQRQTQALAQVATWRHNVRSPELAHARDDEQAAWAKVLGTPGITLQELFDAWLSMRVASSLHFEASRANATEADRRLGIRTQDTPGRAYGMEIPRTAPAQDYAAATSWEWAVAKHLEMLAAAAFAAETAIYDQRAAAALAETD
jgi:hypothetical protein